MLSFEIGPEFVSRKLSEIIEPPIHILVNKFDEESAKGFADTFRKAEQTEQPIIPVYIDSYGGSVYGLMSIVDCILSSKKTVATIAIGKAMSCGIDLLSFGAEGYRFAAPNATLMMHESSGSAWGKVNEVKASAEEIDRMNDKIFRMVAKNCGKPEDYFLKIMRQKRHAEWYLTPEEALKHNIINHICVPKLHVNVKAEFSFDCEPNSPLSEKSKRKSSK